MIDDRLQDLIIPADEAGFNTELWLGLALLFCLCALAIWRWKNKRNTPLFTAQKKLQNLIKSTSQQTDYSQQTVLDLVSILCQGFAVNRLDQIQTNDNKAWAIFQDKLNTACYSTDSKSDIQALLNEAKHWISIK